MNARVKPFETSLAPQLEKNKQRRRTIVIIVSVVAAVAGVVMFQLESIRREVNRWRSRSYATKAEVQISAEQWQAAQEKAKTAYQLCPEEPTAIRAVARLQSLTGNPKLAVQFWEALAKVTALTAEDRRMRAEDLLRSGALADARKEVEQLLADAPADPANLRLGAKCAAAEKNFEKAINLASRALEIDPKSPPGVLLLGLLQCDAPHGVSREAGIRTLFRLVEDRGRQGLEAIVYLAGRKELSPDQVDVLIKNLRVHPLAGETHQLLALDLEINTHPDRSEAVIEAAMQRYKTAAPSSRRAFGVWLNSRKEFDRTLEIIPPAEAVKRQDFLLVALDAMAQQKRWPEIEEILQEKEVPLDDFYTELYLARSAMELGHRTNADLHWRRAHVAAGPSVENMWTLGTYAEKIGETDRAEQAFRALTSNAATARAAYEALLRLAEKRRDTEMVHDLLAEMSKRWPQDNSVRNDFAYFSLLRGEDLEEGFKIARELVQQSPGSLAHRTTLALANLRLKNPAAALAVYRNLSVPWDKTPVSHRAVYAAVLGANGKVDEARTLVAAVPVEGMRPEERELISQWRAR